MILFKFSFNFSYKAVAKLFPAFDKLIKFLITLSISENCFNLASSNVSSSISKRFEASIASELYPTLFFSPIINCIPRILPIKNKPHLLLIYFIYGII